MFDHLCDDAFRFEVVFLSVRMLLSDVSDVFFSFVVLDRAYRFLDGFAVVATFRVARLSLQTRKLRCRDLHARYL